MQKQHVLVHRRFYFHVARAVTGLCHALCLGSERELSGWNDLRTNELWAVFQTESAKRISASRHSNKFDCWTVCAVLAPKGQCTDCTDISRKSASDGSSGRVYGGVCLCMFVWWLSSSWTQNYERNSSSLFSALSFPSHVFASISRSPWANPQQVLPLTLRALSLPLKFALHRVTVRGAGGKILYGARHAASPSFA